MKMKSVIFAAAMIPSISMAANYSLSGSWQDQTIYNPADLPVYQAEYRVNGGAATALTGLTAPAFATSVTANPTDVIEARSRNCNTYQSTPPLCSPWSNWLQATAPYIPTQPVAPTGFSIVLTPQ